MPQSKGGLSRRLGRVGAFSAWRRTRSGEPTGEFASETILRRSKLHAGITLAFALLVFSPHALNFENVPVLGLPELYAGDEPHYLLMIQSLILDGDLDLRNNYTAVHEGAWQAGRRFETLKWLDHHSRVDYQGESVLWYGVFHGWMEHPWVYDESGFWHPVWIRDAAGDLVPTTRPGIDSHTVGAPEYPSHPIGLALLLAPLLLPLRGTPYVEPAAIVCSGLAVFGALLAFRMLLGGFTDRPWRINMVTLAAFLGSPIWFYGRSFYTEPYLLLCAVGAYALAMRKGSVLGAASLIGFGMQIKPTIGILAFPLLGALLVRREILKSCLFCLPLAISTGAVLVSNRLMYGSYLTPAQPFVVAEDVREGLVGLMVHSRFGLLFFAPTTLIALACWPSFLRNHRREALILLSAFLVHYLLISYWACWHGALAYGPRLLVPVLPFLLASLVRLWELGSPPRVLVARGAFALLLIAGLVTNGLAALNFKKYWNSHPLIEVLEQKALQTLPRGLLEYYHQPMPWE